MTTFNPIVGTPTILVAERNPIARTSLSELFHLNGHRVHQAADSDSAIIHLKNNEPIQVVMLDVQMPSWQSVFAFARDKVSVPIVLGMGIQHALDTQQFGFDGYLSKPLEFDNVCGTIARLMMGQAER